MRVAVVGAGKMGLPLAAQLAANGADVVACDIDPAVVTAIDAGDCPIDEPGVPELVAEAVSAGRLHATTDTAGAVCDREVVIIIVPALLGADRDIDVGPLGAASRAVAQGLQPNTMVIYETTMPVGGTRRLLAPQLETSGLSPGDDFDLVFSPERVKSQRVLRHLTVNPKVVGGHTPAAAARAEDFYGKYLGAPVTNVGTLEAAEMVKLAGMVYRDVTIALSNELARYAEAVGVDLPDLLPAINSDGEANLLSPGIGVGGHCTPVYPHFLLRDAERRGIAAGLAARARVVNDGQPAAVLDAVAGSTGPLAGRRVLVLGVAFRPGVNEHAYSSAFALRDALAERGADARFHDPLYSPAQLDDLGLPAGDLEQTPAPEVLVLNTAHEGYLALDWAALRGRGVRVVVDGRNVLDPDDIEDAGLHYHGVGRAVAPVSQEPPPVALARPELGEDEAQAVADVVRSGWIMQGPRVAKFETDFAEFVGSPHACAVSSGTAALHLALLAAGVGPGSQVVTVSHSYIATANAVRHCGAVPVFVDIDPHTYNLDPAVLEDAITSETAAVLVVHQMGMPADMAAIRTIAQWRGLPVVEDAACAAGSEILLDGRWQRIGAPHGDIACFSLHPRKVLTTGEGGVITTRNADWDDRVRTLRQHGVRRSATGVELISEVGFNYRLTDMQAAIGSRQLARLEGLVAHRRGLVDRYRERLAVSDVVHLPVEPSYARSNWQSFCVRLDPASDAAAVRAALAAGGIASRPGIHNAHEMPPYRDETRLPYSEAAARHGIMLPVHSGMDDAAVDRVVATLLAAVTKAAP
jgi:nucleotide sugar dehydrogenase